MIGYGFDHEALDEYEQAVVYYEERREGLGVRFITAVERAIESAMAMPNAGALWPGLPPDAEIRRRSVPGFPALFLAYTVINEQLQIIAVVHAQRQPGYWFQRLQRLDD